MVLKWKPLLAREEYKAAASEKHVGATLGGSTDRTEVDDHELRNRNVLTKERNNKEAVETNKVDPVPDITN
jgi:hypothetical protein